MINGKVPVIWSKEDYINLPWFTNDVHEEKFNSTVDTQNYNVGVAMCFDGKLLVKFYDSVSTLPLEKKIVAVNKLSPGQILPYHTDKYQTYRTRNNITDNDVVQRVIVFLHNQKAGHQLWIEDRICVGEAGSYFGWDQGTEHMAANLGHEDRYILQVTGVKC